MAATMASQRAVLALDRAPGAIGCGVGDPSAWAPRGAVPVEQTVSDLHRLPFSGTVDWRRLARIAAQSAYAKPVSLEVSMHNTAILVKETFLA
jgi:hypothetical protein